MYDSELFGYPTASQPQSDMEDYSIWNNGSIFFDEFQREFSLFALGHAAVDPSRVNVGQQYASETQSISVDSMDKNYNREGSEQNSLGRQRQRTLSEFLEARPSINVLETQLDDSVLGLPNSQNPWSEAQQMDSEYHPQHWGFGDSVESLLEASVPRQGQVLESAAGGPEQEPTNPCTLCSAEDHDCIQDDCHEGAT